MKEMIKKRIIDYWMNKNEGDDLDIDYINLLRGMDKKTPLEEPKKESKEEIVHFVNQLTEKELLVAFEALICESYR